MVHVRQHMVLLSPRSVCVSACARACARACVRAYVCVKLGIVFPAGAFAFVGSEACEHLAIFAQEGPGCSTHHPSKAVCFSEGVYLDTNENLASVLDLGEIRNVVIDELREKLERRMRGL